MFQLPLNLDWGYTFKTLGLISAYFALLVLALSFSIKELTSKRDKRNNLSTRYAKIAIFLLQPVLLLAGALPAGGLLINGLNWYGKSLKWITVGFLHVVQWVYPFLDKFNFLKIGLTPDLLIMILSVGALLLFKCLQIIYDIPVERHFKAEQEKLIAKLAANAEKREAPPKQSKFIKYY